ALSFACRFSLSGLPPRPPRRHPPPPQPGQVFLRVAHTRPTLILAEGYVQHPMQPVLDTPVLANPLSQHFHWRLSAADVVALLDALLAGQGPLPRHHHH